MFREKLGIIFNTNKFGYLTFFSYIKSNYTKMNFSNFPIFSEEHFHAWISEITPIQSERGYLIKHDDVFDLGGIRGGKVRQCVKLVYDNLDYIKNECNGGLITAAGLPSPQSTIVSAVAKYFELKCLVTLPIYDNKFKDFGRINASLSQQLGSIVYGVGNPNPNGPEKDALELVKQFGYYQVKFGMNGENVTNTIARQVENIPNSVKNIVIISGSGLSAIGILKGLNLFNKNVENVYVITLSGYFRKNKQKWYDVLLENKKFKGNIHEIRSNIPYQKYYKINDTFEFDLTYESKAWQWMIDNLSANEKTLFWVVDKKIYDLNQIRKINWNKSHHEMELDKIRIKKQIKSHDFF